MQFLKFRAWVCDPSRVISAMPGDVLLAMSAAGLLMGAVSLPRASAASPVADYQFQQTFASSIAGAPDLVPVTAGTFQMDTVNGNPQYVYAFDAGEGFSVNTAGLIAPDNYTIIMEAKLNALSIGIGESPIAKLVDFKDLTSDDGVYNLSNELDFYGATTLPGITTGGVFGTGDYAQFIFTRDASTGEFTAYVDGQEAFSFDDTSDLAVSGNPSDASIQHLYFFTDDDADILPSPLDSESESGSIADLQLYNGPITVPEPASLGIIVSAAGFLLLRRRR